MIAHLLLPLRQHTYYVQKGITLKAIMELLGNEKIFTDVSCYTND